MAEYKRGYCNGTRYDGFVASAEWKALYERMVKLVPQARVIAEPLVENREGCHRGSRYSVDARVAHRASSHMADVPVDAADDLLVEYLVAGLIDSAGADHWYAFEKDWGSDD